MKLRDVLSVVDDAQVVGLEDDVEIDDVVHDSRQDVTDALFCCVTGQHSDGHEFAAAVTAAGAKALLVEREVNVSVPQIIVGNVRKVMGPIAARVHGNPADSLTMVGVTGTNGKTTTTTLLGNVLRYAGWKTEVMGTLTGARTTPEATDLQRQLAKFKREGVQAVAMEVSSHSIAMHRVDGFLFDVAVFTNLSRDHLDFHHSMEEYFAVKAELFSPMHCRQAVVNLDSSYGRLLVDTAQVPTTGFSLEDLDDVEMTISGSTFRWRNQPVQLDLAGGFNLSNALAAATAAQKLSIGDDVIAQGLSQPIVVSGRFERVECGQPFSIIVDYAHTPDGLDQLLLAADEVVAQQRKVIVVFGCGGDRDTTKRSAMGAVAARRADVVVVTSDNSRSESTVAIMDAIQEGFDNEHSRRAAQFHRQEDRRAAIALALQLAEPGDVVLLAGKGHETTQTIGTTVVEFDDRIVAQQEWRALEAAQ
jgi:UDP-N-acetylmuramoyl-L-alanyl-D-glutamate--2,6-diaminopimelate ligase